MDNNLNHTLLEEPRTQMGQLTTNMGEVQDLFNDMAVLVTEQAPTIDNIQTDIESSSYNIESAATELLKANRYKTIKRRRICRCIYCAILTTTITILLYLVTSGYK